MRYDIQQNLSKEEEFFAREKLTEFNHSYAGPPNFSEIRLAIRDESSEIVGALYGTVIWGWLHVNVLWVTEELRGQGYGKELLAFGEELAIQRGCKYVKLHTFSFQAKPFYETHGYKSIAETTDFPEGHVQYLMFKAIP